MTLFRAVRLHNISRLRRLTRRRLFSLQANMEKISNNGGISKIRDGVSLGTHTPPLAIRSLLVGSATTLATPLFPVIGIYSFMSSFVDPHLRWIVAGGSSLFMFSTIALIPNAFYYVPLLLPFAVGNGITSGVLYLASDICAGGPVNLAKLKIGPVWLFGGLLSTKPPALFGPALGVATAFAAPFTYPLCWALVWPESGAGQFIMDAELYNFIFNLYIRDLFVPSALVITGAAAGGLLHEGLRPVMVGVPGFDWGKIAGAVLAACALGIFALYSAGLHTDVEHLSDIATTQTAQHFSVNMSVLQQLEYIFFDADCTRPCYVRGKQELCWVPGLDHRSADVVSVCREVSTSHDSNSAVATVMRGVEQATHSHSLRTKAMDQLCAEGVELYESRDAAYFAGTGINYLFSNFVRDNKSTKRIEQDDIEQINQALPVGEAVLTDALVLVAVGKVPGNILKSSLSTVVPLLSDSSLAQRLRASSSFERSLVSKLFSSSSQLHWAARAEGMPGALDDDVDGDGDSNADVAMMEVVDCLCTELDRRVAQLRELHRLQHGAAPGPVEGEALAHELEAAGFEVDRALEALELMAWQPSTVARQADWDTITAAQKRENLYKLAGQTMVVGSAVAAWMWAAGRIL